MNSRFVDSNIFIYVILGDPSYSAKALEILTSFEEASIVGWTSLVLSQVFSHLKKRGKHNAIDKFYDYLDGSALRIAETTRDDLNEARRRREHQGLPWTMWDDLVLASQMQRPGISEIYSRDKDFDKIRGLKRFF